MPKQSATQTLSETQTCPDPLAALLPTAKPRGDENEDQTKLTIGTLNCVDLKETIIDP